MKARMILFCLWVSFGLHMTGYSALAQAIVAVDCGIGQTITDALTNASPGDTMQVTGLCFETVTITTDRLTLDGQGSAIVDGGGGFEPGNFGEGVINIVGAQGVRITGLTVQNGPDGINGRRGAAFEVTNTTIQNHADEGLQVDENTTARLIDCTVQRNAANGVFAIRNSSITLIGNMASRENGIVGMSIGTGSSATLSGTIDVSNNGGDGIGVGTNAVGVITSGSSVSIDQNGRFGLFVVNSSNMLIGGNSTVSATNNGASGIGIFRTSSFETGSGSEVSSQSNGDVGLRLSGTVAAVCFGALTLTGNTQGDIAIGENSTFGNCPSPTARVQRLDVPVLGSEDLSL